MRSTLRSHALLAAGALATMTALMACESATEGGPGNPSSSRPVTGTDAGMLGMDASVLPDSGLRDGGFDAGGPSDSAVTDPVDAAGADATIAEGGMADAGSADTGVTPPACAACGGSTPACVDNKCVQCDADERTQCTATEVCDLSQHRCVDKYQPWQLDCAALPANTTCQGGPREVLLAAHSDGTMAMFDPVDGHFLGYMSRRSLSLNAQDTYEQVVQGPDQCLWAARKEYGGVERFTPEGEFIDAIIPRGKHLVDGNDVIDDVTALAFTEDHVYVASASGYPEPRVTRFGLDGSFDKVILDDGSIVQSLLALRDGSLLVSDHKLERIVRLPADGSPAVPVLGSLLWAGRMSYVGAGEILAADYGINEKVYRVAVDTGVATSVEPKNGNNRGLALLQNGRWLVSGSGNLHIASAAPPPATDVVSVWGDPAVLGMTKFTSIERACLSEEFVTSRAPAHAEVTCPGGPSTPAIYDEDFEEGDFTGTGTDRQFNGLFDRGGAGVVTEIDLSQGANGSTRSLKITGGAAFNSGVLLQLAPSQPTYVSYRMKVGNTRIDSSALAALMDLDTTDVAAFTFATYSGLYAYRTDVEKIIAQDVWLHVELRNIDWKEHTYDLYVDCVREAENILFEKDTMTSVDGLALFNSRSRGTGTAVAWFDDVVVK